MSIVYMIYMGSWSGSYDVRTFDLEHKKGKDVDLYSAFHAPGTANAHVTETGPLDRYLGHRQACKHRPNNRHRQRQPASTRSPPFTINWLLLI